MKLEVKNRQISEITVTDDAIEVVLQFDVIHGKVAKQTTPIVLEHTVDIAPLFPGEGSTGIDDAIAMAVAGVQRRADETIKAITGLTEL